MLSCFLEERRWEAALDTGTAIVRFVLTKHPKQLCCRMDCIVLLQLCGYCSGTAVTAETPLHTSYVSDYTNSIRQ